MYLIKAIPGTWNLRLSRDGELEGMDLHEHGTPAYHVEFGQGMSYSAPPGFGSGTGNGGLASTSASSGAPVPASSSGSGGPDPSS